MLSPATLAALHRLVAILLALVDALAAPVDGVRRPLVTRLATGVFSAYLKRLAASLNEMADKIVADPAPQPQPHPTRAHRIRRRHTPSAHRIIRLPSPPPPETNPFPAKIRRIAAKP